MDFGETWSPITNLSSLLHSLGPLYVGPGVGLQLQHGVHAGRLLFIGYPGANNYSAVWYSDDGGASYAISDTHTMQSMEEVCCPMTPNCVVLIFRNRFIVIECLTQQSQLAEAPDGTIVATMRNRHLNASCPCVATAFSVDGGVTFSELSYNPSLLSPVCMTGLLSYKDFVSFSHSFASIFLNLRILTVIRCTSLGLTLPPIALLAWCGAAAMEGARGPTPCR